MPKGLKRYYGRGDLHFLTFSCYQRLPLLGTVRARNLFVRALYKIRERYKFLLVGYVVMPNHVHLLLGEAGRATPSLILKVLKQAFLGTCGRASGARLPADNCAWHSRQEETCRVFGNRDSMTSTCGARRKSARS